MRLLTDTCSAIKLLALGNKLFAPNALSRGDLIIHPRVFNETRKWPSYKKTKYNAELTLLNSIRSTPNLRPANPNEVENLQTIITATMEQIGLSIGSADIDQLTSAIYVKAEIVTNDAPFAEVAEALDVSVHTAERILIEAYEQGVITKNELIVAEKKWIANNEKPPSNADRKRLTEIKRS